MDSESQDGSAGSPQSWELTSDTRRPLPELIEEKILALIESGELPRGAQLPNEPELASRLGVGRSSLRAALQRLQHLRVVDVERGRGTFVRSTTVHDPQTEFVDWIAERRFADGDLLEVRIALEGTAASLAAVRAGDSELDEIAKLSTDHRNVPDAEIDALVETDEALHDAIVRASHNDFLLATYRMLVPELSGFRRKSFMTSTAPSRAGTEHDLVVNFLRRHDSAGARTALTSHLFGLYQQHAEQRDDGQPADLATFVGIDDEPEWPQR